MGDLLEVELPEGDWDTVGGLVLGLLGHLPEQGEAAETDGFLFIANEIVGRRVTRVMVEAKPSNWDQEDTQA